MVAKSKQIEREEGGGGREEEEEEEGDKGKRVAISDTVDATSMKPWVTLEMDLIERKQSVGRWLWPSHVPAKEGTIRSWSGAVEAGWVALGQEPERGARARVPGSRRGS